VLHHCRLGLLQRCRGGSDLPRRAGGTCLGIVYADIDLDDCIVPKQFHDVVGYYNRFDVFNLQVNRATLEPAVFHDLPPTALADTDLHSDDKTAQTASFTPRGSGAAGKTSAE
jgi:hypothetical protein